MITKEVLEKRLAMLRNQRQETLQDIENKSANVNAYNGAIQDCEHWLSVLAKDEPEAHKETARLTKVD